LIGGSPCQGFSFSGKQLNFDDPRSKLFFEFVRLVEELKPKYWLLENVVMKKDQAQIISNELGVYPVVINSSLVSAQNRERLYWTNIPGDDTPTFYGVSISKPKDKKISYQDVIEFGFVDKFKSNCL
jgi:DNA (cytosine-5)-methyltransferase 3A